MATMQVKVEKRNIGFGTEKKEMYVSRADRGSVYDIEDLAHQVSLESGVNERQFKAAVECMVDAMILFLKGGHGVSLKDFATFLPEVKSISSENPDEVGVQRVRISMRPHKKLYEAVGGISYETENMYASGGSSSGSDDTGGSGDSGGTDDEGGTEFT